VLEVICAGAGGVELAQAIAVLARAQQDAVWGPHPGQQQAPFPPA
jgi:hypothetical protein